MSQKVTIVNSICTQLDFNLAFAKKLVEDLTPEQMTAVPGKGFENHPAFTLGHLVSAMSLMVIDDFKDSRKPGFMPEGGESYSFAADRVIRACRRKILQSILQKKNSLQS